MPRNVMASEPRTWVAIEMKAQTKLPCCNCVTTSAEKVEKVVNPPKNPVITSKRHCGDSSTCREKYAKATPIKYPPTKLATKVPGGMDGHKLLSRVLSNQRSKEPSAAPKLMEKMEFIKKVTLSKRWKRKR